MTLYKNWREYQVETSKVFQALGYSTEIEARVKGARAIHDIDVFVTFLQHGIDCSWVVECKFWNTQKVPKEKIAALKYIVDDVGADRGIIISEKGFQPCAYDAARFSNITLVTSLKEFENTVASARSKEKQLSLVNDPDSGIALYTFPNGGQPQKIAKYEKSLVVGNWKSGNITLVNPEDKIIESVIELDNYEEKSHKTNQRVIRQYPPGDMAVTDGKLFLGQVFSDFILAIDLKTKSIVKRIFIPGGGQGAISASHDGRNIYFASNKVNSLFIIDSATYEYNEIPYPDGGRGSLTVMAHPSNGVIYIGIQRGGQINGRSYFGGNCFLAIYDSKIDQYVGNIYLAEIENNRSDDATPICLTYDVPNECVYVGMFQSKKGIYKICGKSHEILENYSFPKNKYNKHFSWVDPLSQAIYRDKLVTVNRNNCELSILNKSDGKIIDSIFLGEAPNGPKDVAIINDKVVVTYPGKNALIFIDLDKYA